MNYTIKRILTKQAKEYIHKYHYSHGSHNAPSPCYGLFNDDELIGVCMFATPIGESVRECLFGKENKEGVIELHRFHILDVTPRNAESWFISRALNNLHLDKPKIKGVISFADPTVGHVGTIYRATNALYCGRTSKKLCYIDKTGRLRHPRQNGKDITKEMAKELGWTSTRRESKYRYIWIIGDNKADKRYWRKKLKLEVLQYPKE